MDNTLFAECYCGRNSREIVCGSDGVYSQNYSCQNVCGKPLACGNHTCAELCHHGDCKPCKTAPEVVTVCNCGKKALSQLENVVKRTACTDSIPSCGQVCGRVLNCGAKCKNYVNYSTGVLANAISMLLVSLSKMGEGSKQMLVPH